MPVPAPVPGVSSTSDRGVTDRDRSRCRMAADLVTILVVSFILTLMTLPAVGSLDRRGVPHGTSVAIVSLGAFLLLLGLVGLLLYDSRSW